MSSVCILTDSAVQFPYPNFTGRNFVYQLPVSFSLDGGTFEKSIDVKAAHFPASLLDGFDYRLRLPTAEDVKSQIFRLGNKYDHVLIILQAEQLNPLALIVKDALEDAQVKSMAALIDSRTTSIGLGMLVQKAAEMANANENFETIEKVIREMISKTYSVLCIEGMSYLHRFGMISRGQAFIGEKTGMLPFFVIEEGILTPTEKARSHRHLADIFFEFLYEFPNLEHIAIVQGAPPFEQESRVIREQILEEFPEVPISEHIISSTLASVIGPRSLGIITLQA